MIWLAAMTNAQNDLSLHYTKPGALLLIWFIYNPSIDKYSQAQ